MHHLLPDRLLVSAESALDQPITDLPYQNAPWRWPGHALFSSPIHTLCFWHQGQQTPTARYIRRQTSCYKRAELIPDPLLSQALNGCQDKTRWIFSQKHHYNQFKSLKTMPAHLSISIKSQTGHTVCVHISQDGYGGQRVWVPHTDVRIFSNLTRGYLDLIRV